MCRSIDSNANLVARRLAVARRQIVNFNLDPSGPACVTGETDVGCGFLAPIAGLHHDARLAAGSAAAEPLYAGGALPGYSILECSCPSEAVVQLHAPTKSAKRKVGTEATT